MNKVVIITGASGDLGNTIAKKMADEGNSLVLVDLRGQNAEEEHVISIQADITKEREVAEIYLKTFQKFGQVDILINNAGVIKDSPLVKMTEEDWDFVLDVNLKGAFLMCREFAFCIPSVYPSKIVNISSVNAYGCPTQANYSASKAGLIGLTKSLALELARRQVTVNAVLPGYITSTMTSGIRDYIVESIIKKIPLGRFAELSEIADAVCFLASDKANYITGACLDVNGGLHV